MKDQKAELRLDDAIGDVVQEGDPGAIVTGWALSVSSNLSLLGFTPVDRAKLEFAEVRGFSKIEELKKRRAELLGH